jgi:uncharacterized transporter YbjL
MNFNPMNMIVNRIKQRMGNNNPMMNNVIQMAQNNDVNGLKQFAENVAKEKGVDVNSYYNQAMQMFGMNKN